VHDASQESEGRQSPRSVDGGEETEEIEDLRTIRKSENFPVSS